MKDPEDVYVPAILDEIDDAVVPVEQDAHVAGGLSGAMYSKMSSSQRLASSVQVISAMTGCVAPFPRRKLCASHPNQRVPAPPSRERPIRVRFPRA